MKILTSTFILLMILCVSLFAFAGGSVGTMKTAREQLQNGTIKADKSELIFNMGTKDGLQKFAKAKLIQGQWEVAEFVTTVEQVQVDYDFSKALSDSKEIQDWAELK